MGSRASDSSSRWGWAEMRTKLSRWPLLLCLALPAACTGVGTTRQTDTIHPGEVWKDTHGDTINAHGAGLLHDGNAWYWYGEIKGDGEHGNTAEVGVSAYRSTDLVHWSPLGVALAVSDDPASDIARGAIIERPKVIRRADGRFIMWFHLERAGHGYHDALIGVAEATTANGPFRFVRSFQPNGQQSRDMTLFQDDDGAGYVFYSSENNDSMHIARLTVDYLGVRDGFERAFVGDCYEAPSIFKSAGKYWFVGSTCTGWRPNAAHGAMADSPMGPWHEFGNPAVGDDADLTFHSQSAYVLPLPGQPGHFIYVGDRWKPEHPSDGRYIWLPLTVEGDRFRIDWSGSWNPLVRTVQDSAPTVRK